MYKFLSGLMLGAVLMLAAVLFVGPLALLDPAPTVLDPPTLETPMSQDAPALAPHSQQLDRALGPPENGSGNDGLGPPPHPVGPLTREQDMPADAPDVDNEGRPTPPSLPPPAAPEPSQEAPATGAPATNGE